MKKSNIHQTAIRRPQHEGRSNWQYYAIATICCGVLVAGFFFAARQHFSSMEYGLQNSRLRHHLDELQSEKRRLLVTREISMTPDELRKAAKRIGFLDTPTTKSDAYNSQDPVARESVIKTVETSKPVYNRPANKVLPTVISAPVKKSERLDKQARRETVAARKDRT